MKKYLKITVPVASGDASDILMAQLLDIGFYSFEEVPGALVAYIEQPDFDESRLLEVLNNSADYTATEIDEQNWNEEWERSYQPVVLRDFAAVRASFQAPVTAVTHEIIITPKMSFGTGHHPTTLMMMDLMSTLRFQDETVIDFGTGTGVLAILAEKLGAVSVDAVDNDSWSIENALENVQANNCSRITVRQADDISESGMAGIILANINLSVLLHNAVALSEKVHTGGHLLVSGFLQADLQQINNAFVRAGLALHDQREENNWVAAAFVKGS